MKPQVPDNEKERLKVLHELQILDTMPEEEYEDITLLASEICGTPIALISLVDAERQYFKSARGMKMSESHRDHSFCAHAINHPHEVFEVKDARVDGRFENNPFVTTDKGVVFYTGVPLVTLHGLSLGTLCVIDHEPKKLSDRQIKALNSLANQVMKLLELRKKNMDLIKSEEQLKSHAKQMENFAYLASHDLKEPLRMISGFMNLLNKNYSKQLDEKANEYIHIAIDGSSRMTRMIDEMLAYARAGSEVGNPEPVSVMNIMEDIVAMHKESIKESRARITWGQLPNLRVRKTPISMLLRNLILNALKYQHKDRDPIIHVAAEEQAHHWLFSVEDNGIGMDREYQDAIFQPFLRLNNTNGVSGTGLGLATCKKIVEQMGGDIWTDSKPLLGSTFYFTVLKD